MTRSEREESTPRDRRDAEVSFFPGGREETTPRARIAALARRQRGLVTGRQLVEAGLSTSAISRRVAAGTLHRVHPRVYAVGYVPTAPLAREAAALLTCGAGAALGFRAAAVGSLLLPARADAPVDVIVPRERRVRIRGIRVHHVTLARGETVIRDGLRMTTPRRTILDLAATVGPVELAQAVDAAYVRGLIRPGELAVPDGIRGAARLRAVLDGRGLTRSAVERRFLALVRRAGLPRPETNARVAGYEVDAVWREQRVAVEIDTLGTHAAKVLTDRDKDLALREAGFEPLRFTDVQLDERPERVVAQAVRALAGTSPHRRSSA